MTEADVAGLLGAVLSHTGNGRGGYPPKSLCEGGLVQGYPKRGSRCSGTSISWEHTRCAHSQAPTPDLFKTDSLGTGAQACGFAQARQMIFLHRDL